MKLIIRFSFLLLILGLSFTACKKAPKGVDSKTTAASNAPATANKNDKMFSITNGQLQWTATKVGGEHQGVVKVSGGDISASNGKISAGEVKIDMSSISVTDLKANEGKAKLEGHLKTADFFNTEAYPNATFKLTSSSGNGGSTSLTGDLTIKGITKSITVPANVAMAGDKISIVTPSFKINRTEWDVKYGSDLIGTAADKIIHNEIGLVLSLTGQAK